ncbi:hypothetical protein [Chromobacterium amazonense]|nr:hypothetical protein [Chromobacterium amazonense]MDE1712776.1 hypothetical protein [Chromobacterium amazonense]
MAAFIVMPPARLSASSRSGHSSFNLFMQREAGVDGPSVRPFLP